MQNALSVHDAMNTNLDAFKAKGGKVLLAHGTSDTIDAAAQQHRLFRALATALWGTTAARSFGLIWWLDWATAWAATG
ncbi:MAG: tannase/feruloyl esterase family alpha/beta hydrolase [Burkholderiaceae bacterium]